MATVKQSVEEQIAALARRRESGEIDDAEYDSTLLQLLSSDAPAAPVVSGSDSSLQLPPIPSTGPQSSGRRWPVITLATVVLVLLVGLGVAVANVMSQNNRLQQNAAEIADLQEQTAGYRTQVTALTADNVKLKQQVESPTVPIIRLQGRTSGGGFYFFGIPAGFSVSISLTSSSPVDVRLFGTNQFLAWYIAGAVKGQGSSSTNWLDRTSLSNATFDGARGCAAYVLVIDGNSNSISLTATGVYSPSSTPTGICAG